METTKYRKKNGLLDVEIVEVESALGVIDYVVVIESVEFYDCKEYWFDSYDSAIKFAQLLDKVRDIR